MSNILLPKPALGTPIAKGQLLSKGLVAYYLFNEGRGDILGNSSLEKGIDGTITGAVWAGQGLKFENSSDKVALSTSIINANGTVCIWFNSMGMTTTESAQFFVIDNSSGQFRIQRSVYDYRLAVQIGGNAAELVVMPNNQNLWDSKDHMLVATWDTDNNFQTWYLDGQFIRDDSGAITAPTLAGTLFMGNRLAGSHQIKQRIDQVLFYNRPLSASEVIQLYLNLALPMQQPPIWLFTPPVVVGTTPKGPLGHPLHGPFAGPIAC